MKQVSNLIDQIRTGNASLRIRELAARGLVPLPEDELIPLQIRLSEDADGGIRTLALASLQTVTESTWKRLLSSEEADRALITFCLEQFPQPSLKEIILTNTVTPDDLVARLALNESGTLVDLIIENQVRILRDPEILENLERNPHLTIDQKRRIQEFKKKFAKGEGVTRIEDLPFEDILAQIPTLDAEAQRIIQEIDRTPESPVSEVEVQKALKSLFTDEEIEQLPEETLTTYQRILRMKQGEKIRLALLGTREERNILIRDSNRAVSTMVIRCPKLTDPEMESYAQMRNLDSHLLAQMGRSREFLKRYTVIHLLVKNPKTPSPVAINLLKLIRTMDLRNIERDRNIPELVRRQARRIRFQKEDRKE